MQALDDIARAHGLELVLQFGSTTKGVEHEKSDLDIAVLVAAPRMSATKFGELYHALQDLFPEAELDLAFLNHADPLFLKKVLEHCRSLYGSERRLAELRMYAFRRYQEHRRFLLQERQHVDRVIERLAARA